MGGTAGGMARGPRGGVSQAAFAAPAPSSPVPLRWQARTCPSGGTRGNQPAPRISPPPPASLSPARPQRDGRGAGGGRHACPAPPWGSQRWHWGHRVRRGSGQTRESRPGPSQSRYGWVGGEMPFKGPGRWPHVQEPGPGSRRRRSSSGSVPWAGWGREGGCPVPSTWSPLPRDAAITCKGTAAPPATRIPLKSIQASQPSPTPGKGEEGGGLPPRKGGRGVGLSRATANVPFGVQGTVSGAPWLLRLPQAGLSVPRGYAVQMPPALPFPGEGDCSGHTDHTGYIDVSINPRRRCLHACSHAPWHLVTQARAPTSLLLSCGARGWCACVHPHLYIHLYRRVAAHTDNTHTQGEHTWSWCASMPSCRTF